MRFIGMEIHRDFCEVAICEDGKGTLDRADPDGVEQLELFPTATASRSVRADEPASGALRQPCPERARRCRSPERAPLVASAKYDSRHDVAASRGHASYGAIFPVTRA